MAPPKGNKKKPRIVLSSFRKKTPGNKTAKKDIPKPGTSKTKSGKGRQPSIIPSTSRKRSSESDSSTSQLQTKKKRVQDGKQNKSRKSLEKPEQGKRQKKTTPKTQGPKKRKGQIQDDFREKRVSAKRQTRWKPVPKSTQDLVVGLFDQAIMYSLNHASNVSYEAVQDTMNNLKDSLTKELKELKVPTAKYTDYRKMENQCKLLEEVLVQSSNQVELMESQAEQLEVSVEETEEEIKKITEDTNLLESSQAKWKKRLHPSIRGDHENELNVVPLPEESYQLPVPVVEDDLDPRQTRLLKRLSNLQRSNAANDLSEYVENVSAVANALNEMG